MNTCIQFKLCPEFQELRKVPDSEVGLVNKTLRCRDVPRFCLAAQGNYCSKVLFSNIIRPIMQVAPPPEQNYSTLTCCSVRF